MTLYYILILVVGVLTIVILVVGVLSIVRLQLSVSQVPFKTTGGEIQNSAKRSKPMKINFWPT